MQVLRGVFRHNPNLSAFRITDIVVHWRPAATLRASVTDRERQHFLLELGSQASKWGVEPESVMTAVKNCPELGKYSPSQWDSVFSTLKCIGFKGPESLEALEKCPTLLVTDPKNVAAVWYALTVFKLNTSKLVPVLVSKPYLLCNSPKDADDKALEILNFTGGKNNALRTMEVCDNPFALSLIELKKVIEYVKEVMKVRRTHEICRSRVVECPLLKLKCRHSFLVDCGLYHPQDEDIPVTIPHSNALLCNIVNPDDEVFATKTAKLTYEEYLVYQELFERKQYDEIYDYDD